MVFGGVVWCWVGGGCHLPNTIHSPNTGRRWTGAGGNGWCQIGGGCRHPSSPPPPTADPPPLNTLCDIGWVVVATTHHNPTSTHHFGWCWLSGRCHHSPQRPPTTLHWPSTWRWWWVAMDGVGWCCIGDGCHYYKTPPHTTTHLTTNHYLTVSGAR